jgi:hypothetical protein
MERGWFDRPVPISVGIIGTVHKVSNAREAAEMLVNQWPEEGTAKHIEARRVCLEVLHGQQKADMARAAFAEAAREAAILAEASPASDDVAEPHVLFEKPVKVTVGSSSTVRVVETVQGACEVLIDWPHAQRGPFYQSTREVVEAVIDGVATTEEAREAFAALAEHAGILVDD